MIRSHQINNLLNLGLLYYEPCLFTRTIVFYILSFAVFSIYYMLPYYLILTTHGIIRKRFQRNGTNLFLVQYSDTKSMLLILNKNYTMLVLPNQELSGAKSELPGGTVGVCSFYKRGCQSPYNSALRSLQMCLFVQIQ